MAVQVVLNEIGGELYALLSVVNPPHQNDQFVMEILGDYLTPELREPTRKPPRKKAK